MIRQGDKVIFSTGKTRDARCGIIGLHPNLSVMEGCDVAFYDGTSSEEWRDGCERLSKTELLELADYMIQEWQCFRLRHSREQE